MKKGEKIFYRGVAVVAKVMMELKIVATLRRGEESFLKESPASGEAGQQAIFSAPLREL